MKFGLAPTTWTNRMRPEAKPNMLLIQKLWFVGVPIQSVAAIFVRQEIRWLLSGDDEPTCVG